MTTGPHPDDSPEPERGPGVQIARIAGIPVYLAPSWFVIAVVITAIVAAPLIQTRPLVGIAVGVANALVLLACVLVHEAAHAVTARSLGMPVVRIVATLWGGHTAMEAGRAAPGRLALIAVAGPAANGAVALAAYAATPAVHGDVGSRLLQGLVLINGTLAVLNILPGLPLDGGQVVESLVWRLTGDRNRGLVVAGWCGRLLTLLLVLWFLVRPLVEGRQFAIDGLWILVIASVLWAGATDAIRRGTALGQIERLQVKDIMEAAVLLPPETPLGAAIAYPSAVVTTDERGIPCLILASDDSGVPPGVDPYAPLASAVRRIPDRNVVEISPDAGISAVIAAMQAGQVGHVVLTEHGQPYGHTSPRLVNEAAERN